MVSLVGSLGDALDVFVLVHDPAVEVDVGERIADDVGDGFGVVAGFGFVPSAFELADLDFFPRSGLFLREDDSPDSERDEQNGKRLYHCGPPLKYGELRVAGVERAPSIRLRV